MELELIMEVMLLVTVLVALLMALVTAALEAAEEAPPMACPRLLRRIVPVGAGQLPKTGSHTTTVLQVCGAGIDTVTVLQGGHEVMTGATA